MAKKQDVDFDELSLDDLDWGSEFNFDGDNDIKFDADDDRDPVSSFTSAVKNGVTNRIMDRGLLRRLMSFALPKGYSQAFNAYDSLTNGVADVYKANASELQPYMRRTNTFLKQQKPIYKRLLPKGIQEALDDADREEIDWGADRQDELTRNIGDIDKLLGMQAQTRLEDSVQNATKDIRDRKQFETELGVQVEIGKGIGRLVQYQDSVLINYHRKSLELKYRHLDVAMRTHHASEVFFADATDLLKAVGKNTALPDFVKMRNTEIVKEQLRHRLANNVINSASNFANKHLGSIGKNISDSIGGFFGQINMATSMGDSMGMSRAAMAGDAAGGLASEAMAEMLEFGIKEALTRLKLGEQEGKIKEGGRFLQDKFSGWSQRLNDYARSETTRDNWLGTAEDWLKRLFDSYSITDKINGGGVYALDEQAKFDNLFHRTVTEIIPGQLASMEKWLRTIATGEDQEEHAYSHYTGGFVTRSTLNQQHIDIGLKAGAGDAVRKQLDYQLKTMEADGLSNPAKRALRARLLTDMSANRDFVPKTYAKATSWTGVDPNVAEELVEYFAGKYGVNIDGEYDPHDTVAAELRTKSRADYLDLAPRLTDYTGRMAGLAQVIGRRSWREMNLAKYDGRSGDNIDVMAVNDMIANEGGDEFVTPDKVEEEKAEPLKFTREGLKEGLNERAKLARKKAKEMEEELKREAAKAAAQGENTRVDVDKGGTKARDFGQRSSTVLGEFGLDDETIEKLSTRLSQVLSTDFTGQYEMSLPENLDTIDNGTHTRLDTAIASLAEILEAIKENDPCKCEGRGPAGPNSLQTAREYAGEVRTHLASIDYKGGVDRARNYAVDQWGVHGQERWDNARGYATDKWQQFDAKGRMEEAQILAAEQWDKLSNDERVTRAKAYAGEQWDKLDAKGKFELVQSMTKEKWAEFDAKGRAQAGWDTARNFDYRGTAEQVRDAAKERYENFDAKAEYARLKDSVGGTYEELSPKAREKFDQAKEYIMERARMDAARELWERFATEAKERKAKGEEVDESDVPDAPKAKKTIKQRLLGLPGAAISGTGSYLSWSYRNMWKMTKGLRTGLGAAAKPVFGGMNGLGVADVHVMGEAEPSLTAKNIRRGFYFDVLTKKVIKEIKDITGPVKDRNGETVLTQEEFDKGLMNGDGESLAGWGLRKTAKVGMKLGEWTGKYLAGSYGLMGRGLKGALSIAIDQFVQFDAYLPGDEEPRIRSSLLKKGYYRNKDGEPLKSLKDINGPVFDIDGNEVVSQEELDKYKSFYTRNGSVLFTVGRGVGAVGGMVGELAIKGVKAYGRAVGKFYKGLWDVASGLGRGIKNKIFKGGPSPVAQAQGYETDEELHTAMFEVSIEQLNTQRSILEILRNKFTPKKNYRDTDGDGERDNSWKSILERRKEAKEKKEGKATASGSNADVVKALDKLGKKLENSIEDLGDRVEEANEDGLLDQAADLAQVRDGWGGGGEEGEGRKRRRGKGKAKGKGKLGRVGRFGSKIWNSRAVMAARGLGTAAWTGITTGASALAASSAGTAVMGAASTAATATMGWLAAGATAIGSILSAPIVLGALAVAAVGYVGYKWYKSSQAKDNPIFYLRMTQYGIDPANEDRVKMLLSLEELLLPAVTFNGDKANLEASRVDIPKMMEIMGIEQGEDKRLQRALKWLASRFRPIFLLHVGAMNKLVKSTKLSEADKLIDGSVIKEFLEIVDIKQFQHVYDNMFISPFDTTMGFGGTLDCDSGDVEDAFALVRDKVKETEKPKDEPTPVKAQDTPKPEDGAEAAMAAGAASLAAGATKGKKVPVQTGEPLDIGGIPTSGIGPGVTGTMGVGAAAAAAATMPVKQFTQVPLPEQPPTVGVQSKLRSPEGEMSMSIKDAMANRAGASDPFSVILKGMSAAVKAVYSPLAARIKAHSSKLDIPAAVRYLAYGLTSFDSEKVKQLQQVEDLYWDFLRFNGYDNALIEGDLVGLEETVISFFQPSGGEPYNILMWLRYRFMPVFLQYAISVRRRLPGDVRQAPERLTSQLMREVLTETIQAVDSDSGNPVWINLPSPWPNYRLNGDSSSTAPYIQSLPQSFVEMVVQDLRLGIGPAKNSQADNEPQSWKSVSAFHKQPEGDEEGGTSLWSGVKKFFGFGEDKGGTAGGVNSNSGTYGMAGGAAGEGNYSMSGSPAPSTGSAVTHPGGGSGGDINSLPNNTGDGWEQMKPIIIGAAKMAGFDPYVAANVAAVESRFKPRAGAGTSSAKGLYQFVNGTWQEMLRKYGSKYGIAPNTHQFDARANALMGMEYLKENYAYLQKNAKGVNVTDTSLYASHFLGAYGAKKFLTSPGAANAADIVGQGAVKANASVFREPTGRKGVYGRVRTVAEAMAEIDKRMKEAQGQHDLRPGQKPVVASGSENEAAENRPQDVQGEPNGAAPETGMDTPAAMSGGDPSATSASSGGGYDPSVGATGGGSSGGEPPVTNASNGAPSAGGGQTYAPPPSSPDAAAAQAAGNAVLTREPDDEQGTYGKLRLPDGTEFFTLELPWRGNATGASCIPPGTYKVAIRNSPKFGRIYEVMNVPGRTAILIHSGNVAGDKNAGYNSHVEGCILLGLNKGKVSNQKAVQQSRAAVAQFMEKMGGQPFTLSVVGAGANANAKSVDQAPSEEDSNFESPEQDPGSVANGASGSNAAANTQGGGMTAAGSSTTPGGGYSEPTLTQASTKQSQDTTALSTAELSQTVGPLLQEQLKVAQSMDSSLKDIRKFLEAMSQQGGMQQAPQGGGQGGTQQTQAQAQEAGVPPPTNPGQRPGTSSGSGRSPIRTQRTNAVT